jgi:hypothetical protein
MRATSSLTQEEAPPLPLGSFYLGVKGVGCGRGGAFPQNFEGTACSLNTDLGKPSPLFEHIVFLSPLICTTGLHNPTTVGTIQGVRNRQFPFNMTDGGLNAVSDVEKTNPTLRQLRGKTQVS